MAEPLRLEDAVNALCPWSGDPISEDALTLYRGAVVGFCNIGCRDKFAKATSAFDEALDRDRAGHGPDRESGSELKMMER
ncbi:glutathione S-transferase [Sphingomonas sp. BIUV-7]|uniref:Glutathione S-transferase n=1 Tax=Sphingomonas natans TaxID=3063330 RepID=A0ABT8Y4S4_9SPHN|nr:glutathione S-transferase [Sphingomonas sp. BIUV-7]MDO6413314.1 glutathione S-transferase [Sphingomonas sp. BIUV-7]